MVSNFLMVARRWSERGTNTDYENFFQYFHPAPFISSEHAIGRPYRVLKAIADATPHRHYDVTAAGLELRAAAHIMNNPTQLVHFWHGDYDFFHLWRATRHRGVKIVGNVFLSLEALEGNTQFLNGYDLILASGTQQQKAFEAIIPPERVAYLPLGVDADFFHPPSDLRQRWDSGPILLHVGFSRRDFETLKTVYLALKQRIPNLRLELVAALDAGDGFRDLPDVTAHPFLSDIDFRNVYQRATLFIQPLLEGASSNALNEALASGLPIVTHDMPLVTDYITNECGALCSSTLDMVEACAHLLTDFDTWATKSIHARQRAHSQFHWSVVFEHLTTLYYDRLNVRPTFT